MHNHERRYFMKKNIYINSSVRAKRDLHITSYSQTHKTKRYIQGEFRELKGLCSSLKKGNLDAKKIKPNIHSCTSNKHVST